MSAPFKMYRIICTMNGKTFSSGSDKPNAPAPYSHDRIPVWHARGSWSYGSGSFFKTEEVIKKHLRNLCYDWVNRSRVIVQQWCPEGRRIFWREAISGPHWDRLKHLRVEQLYVTQHTTTVLDASDFMGIPLKEEVAQ